MWWYFITFVILSSQFQTGNAPNATMAPKFGTNSVYMNASTDIRLKISTYRGVIYSPFTVQINMPQTPDNLTNLFSICRAEVVNVGMNMPCFNQIAANNSISYLNM